MNQLREILGQLVLACVPIGIAALWLWWQEEKTEKQPLDPEVFRTCSLLIIPGLVQVFPMIENAVDGINRATLPFRLGLAWYPKWVQLLAFGTFTLLTKLNVVQFEHVGPISNQVEQITLPACDALRARCPGYVGAVLLRSIALIGLYTEHRENLARWMSVTNENVWIHPAVFDVAAKLPVDRRSAFDFGQFFDALASATAAYDEAEG